MVVVEWEESSELDDLAGQSKIVCVCVLCEKADKDQVGKTGGLICSFQCRMESETDEPSVRRKLTGADCL